MKTISIFFAIFSLCAFSATAQHQLSGTITDGADGSPVPFATAALLHADSTVVTGVMADADGKFVLANVAEGDYILQFSFIGYQKAYRRVNVPAQSDLGEVILAESATRLQEVVVTASRPLVDMRADRYVVNVSGNIQSEGRNVLEIMRNAPGLMVDHMGNITAMGNSVQIWIDGRPSRMNGEQLRNFLNSMQGSEIDRIEVITNPSSRFDAEGAGGIIDIRTRRGLQFGLNGTITAGYQQGMAGRQNAGVSMNWRREKFNMFGNYSVNRNNIWERANTTNVMQTGDGEKVTLDMNTTSKTTDVALRHSVRTGIDYFINPNNILGVIVNANCTSGSTSNLRGRTDLSPSFDGINYSTADNIQSRSSNGIQLNMNYQSKFTQPGQQLNLDFDYARFYSNPFMQTNNSYFDISDAMTLEQMRNTNPQTINVYSTKIDFTQPLWENARMETGTKIGKTTTDNDIQFDIFIDANWMPDPGRTNHFVYTEQISAAYVNINQQLGKFSFQAGLRGEHTHAIGDQRTTEAVNDTSYFNLFPTFFVNYRKSQMQVLGFSYSRRLSRPNFNDLNPFEVTVDAFTFTRGNPHLTPAYTDNFQLSIMWAPIMAQFNYSNTTDLIMFTPIEDVATGRTGVIQKNFGRRQQFTGMTGTQIPFNKVWTTTLMIQGGYIQNTSNEFVNKGGFFAGQFQNNFNITPTLSAELSCTYQSRMRQAYIVMRSRTNVSVGLRQMLLQNKIALSLNVNDIFNTASQRASAQYENVDWKMVQYQDTRFVNLTMRYNFGSTTVRAARNKQTGIEDETTRAGGR